MIDIIIPIYKNKKGLIKTLFSLGVDQKYTIIIIDDYSNESYDDVINFFQQYHDIIIIYNEKNMGPGAARNIGLKQTTSNDFIMFIDAGDILISPYLLPKALQHMRDNPNLFMTSYAHLEEQNNYQYGITSSINNRIHGKIYRKNFLKLYDIQFNESHGYANEDIGFNFICRYLCYYFEYIDNIKRIEMIDEPLISWSNDMTSLVRKDNYAFMYKNQNLGLSKNAIYAFNKLSSLNVPEFIYDEEIYGVLAYLYIIYINTLNSRPEYTKEAFDGALTYYTNYFIKLQSIDNNKLLHEYNKVLREEINNPASDYLLKINTLNFIDFLNLLNQNSLQGENNEL